MTRHKDPWRLPALDRFGEQLRAREASERAPSPRRRPQRPFLRPIAAAAAAAALAIAVLELVAPAGAESPVNEAPRRAREATTVRFASIVRASIGDRPYASVSETGALDFGQDRFATTIEIPGSKSTIEQRKIGHGLYLRQLQRPERKRWFAVDVAPTTATTALGAGYTLMQPQLVFDVMERFSGAVHRLGSSTIDGRAQTHYSLVSSLGAFLRAEHGAGYGSARSSPAARLDVWLDREGRPTRVTTTFSTGSGVATTSLSLTTDFSEYGAPVAVAVPPVGEQIVLSGVHDSLLLQDPTGVLAHALFPSEWPAPKGR